jgi:nucleoside-diphosphate kinase
MERSFIMIKPDGVQRSLIGEIIGRFEKRGLKPIGIKMMRVDEDLAKKHYVEHVEKPFFGSLVEFITSGPVVAMVWQGPEAVRMVRLMVGALNPLESTPGSIRGDLTCSKQGNVVHASDSPESAEREINLWFRPEELSLYSRDADKWLDT